MGNTHRTVTDDDASINILQSLTSPSPGAPTSQAPARKAKALSTCEGVFLVPLAFEERPALPLASCRYHVRRDLKEEACVLGVLC